MANSKEYSKKYYEANKEKIIAKIRMNQNILVQCPICNVDVKRGSLNAHNKTKIHKYIKENKENNVKPDA
jgi:hypothetical protein